MIDPEVASTSLVSQILERSALTKSGLSQASGVSRSQLDAYLRGTSQPSIRQVARLAAAAGVDVVWRVGPRPRPVPEELVAVLEFGDLFPRRRRKELPQLSRIWAAAGR